MSSEALTWTWDSLPTVVTILGVDLAGHRVLTTNLGDAYLWGPNMPGEYHRRLTDAVVVPAEDGGWDVSGNNPDTGEPETWHTAAVQRVGGCGPCGR